MTSGTGVDSFEWRKMGSCHSHSYLHPVVHAQVDRVAAGRALRIVDIGCGRGELVDALALAGHECVGVDYSADGIEIAKEAGRKGRFVVGSVYDADLPEHVGRGVDVVVSLEVIEHLMRPDALIEQARRVLRPGGTLILTTPYHGFLKNLVLSLMNGWDRHFTAAWDGGHVKFFSRATLTRALEKQGFIDVTFRGIGRAPWLWKSMMLSATRGAEGRSP